MWKEKKNQHKFLCIWNKIKKWDEMMSEQNKYCNIWYIHHRLPYGWKWINRPPPITTMRLRETMWTNCIKSSSGKIVMKKKELYQNILFRWVDFVHCTVCSIATALHIVIKYYCNDLNFLLFDAVRAIYFKSTKLIP